MTVFEEKRNILTAVECAYEAVKQRRDWISDNDDDGNFVRPKDVDYALQYDTLTDIMNKIIKMI